MKSRGYTLYEVIFLLVCILTGTAMVAGVWVIIHFISKLW
jgi:hypothetical protein